MKRGYKVRLYPNKAQRDALAVTFGCVRWIYNAGLELCQTRFKETGKQPIYHELQNVFMPQAKADHPWLKEANSQSLQVSLQNLAAAFDAFFAKAARYPRFKSKRSVQAAAYYSSTYVSERRDNGWGKVRIPKIGHIRARLHREVKGAVKHITVTLDRAGRYWAVLQVDDGVDVTPVAQADTALGIDLGLRHFATLSTGEKIDNPRHLRRAEKNLKRKYQQHARKKAGSKNKEKARLKLARAHARIADARKDFLHNLSRRLVNENQAIIVEDLNRRGMMKNRSLAKSIADAGWFAFAAMLAYKATADGKPFVKVGRKFPSTRTCHDCKHVRDALPMGDKEWNCPACGTVHDRDLNAALNIRDEGLRLMAEVCPATASGRRGRRWAPSRLAQRRLKEEKDRIGGSGH